MKRSSGMLTLLVSASLTAAPANVVIRVDMQDALRLPSGVETPPADPLVIFVQAPPAWVKGGAITQAGRVALLAKLYGGPQWTQGNSDGSTYVVKKFESKVLPAGAMPNPDEPHSWWYQVKPDGSLDKRGAGFSEPQAPKPPQSLIDHAEKGSVFKQGPAVSDPKSLREWLDGQKGQVKLAVTLKRAQVGYSRDGAKVGTLTLRLDDTRLGVSLDDRANQHCNDAAACELWLLGEWKSGVFMVNQVIGAPSGAERELKMSAHAWYQAP